MAVTLPKAKKAETIEAVETFPLQLGIYQRYAQGGRVYEAGVVYDFPKETALDLMTEEDNGRPLWKVYRPKKAEQEAQTEPVKRVNVTKPGKVAVAEVPAVEVEAKRLEIGSDEELTELGLNIAHDGGEGSTDGAVTI
jgi:hypothetical protein